MATFQAEMEELAHCLEDQGEPSGEQSAGRPPSGQPNGSGGWNESGHSVHCVIQLQIEDTTTQFRGHRRHAGCVAPG